VGVRDVAFASASVKEDLNTSNVKDALIVNELVA
jgi:hypothetical protein